VPGALIHPIMPDQHMRVDASAFAVEGIGFLFGQGAREADHADHRLDPFLRINIALNRFRAELAGRAGKKAARPHGGQFAQFGELLAQIERRDALARFDDLRSARIGPCAHQEMDMIRLDGQRKDHPSL